MNLSETSWDGDEALHWVTEADRYDGQLAPFADLLLDRLALAATDRVLDVGCGCGATTIRAAQASSAAVGVDLSAPMLAVGRARADAAGVDNVEFVADDAARRPFGAEAFDAVVSRFGVMFFDDPELAFANLRHALRIGGRLVFVCWQDMRANPWLLVPGVAAAAHVPLPSTGDAGGPGMFSLADRDHIINLLSTTGFHRRRTGQPDDHARRRWFARRHRGVPARHRDRPRHARRRRAGRTPTGDRRRHRRARRALRTRAGCRPRYGGVAGQRVSPSVNACQAWKPPMRSVARWIPRTRSSAAARLDW